MIILSSVDSYLIDELARSGPIKSLSAWVMAHGFDYASTHRRVKHLEASGLVAVERPGPGRPITIKRSETVEPTA